MRFVLTDTKELTYGELLEIRDATGKVNCEPLSVDGLRFAPRTALVTGSSYRRGRNAVIEVLRIQDNTRSWLDDSLGNLGGYGLASIEWYPRSMEVDRLLGRCKLPKQPPLARMLRRIRR